MEPPGDWGDRPTSGSFTSACQQGAPVGQGRDTDVLGRVTAGHQGLQLEEGTQCTPGFLPRESPWTGAWWAMVHGVAKSRTQMTERVTLLLSLSFWVTGAPSLSQEMPKQLPAQFPQ